MARGQVKSGGMNESMQLAEKVAAQLARHLTDVVLCPGSRNAPLSLALLARDDIRVHTRLDERVRRARHQGHLRADHHKLRVDLAG